MANQAHPFHVERPDVITLSTFSSASKFSLVFAFTVSFISPEMGKNKIASKFFLCVVFFLRNHFCYIIQESAVVMAVFQCLSCMTDLSYFYSKAHC